VEFEEGHVDLRSRHDPRSVIKRAVSHAGVRREAQTFYSPVPLLDAFGDQDRDRPRTASDPRPLTHLDMPVVADKLYGIERTTAPARASRVKN